MKKLPKILFRTSGGTAYGKELGMGHVYRSINLASHLKKSKIFFLIEDYGSVKQIISQRNFKQVFTLKKDISLKDDLIETTQNGGRQTSDHAGDKGGRENKRRQKGEETK